MHAAEPARRASPTPSTPSPSRSPRCATPTCPSLSSTVPHGRSSSCRTTAGTWSCNAPAPAASCAGTSRELDPDLSVPTRSLRQANTRVRVQDFLDTQEGIVARLASKLLARIVALSAEIKDIEKELRTLVRDLAPTLLAMPGCGELSAALIIGETAGVHRFRDKGAFARFTGTAPVPVWSGASAGKVRLNRGGNHQMNYALHMIAVTQARGVGPGKAYLAKAEAGGKDRVAALRLLRRRLSGAVFSALRADQATCNMNAQQAA